MDGSNEHLWQEEKDSRRRLFKRSFILISVLFGGIGVFSLWITQPLFGSHAVVKNSKKADALQLRSHVEKISNEFYPRNHLSLQNLNLTADYIRTEFEKTGGKVSEQSFNVNGATYRNIVLKFDGTGDESIIVGAHYDADYETHGADDNASGVAGLIELARLLAVEKHKSPIELVAFSLEEPPFFGSMQMGSYIHARSLSEQGARVRLMVCLEMIGYYSDESNSQNFPLILGRLFYPSKGNFTMIVGNFSNGFAVRGFKRSMTSIAGLDTYSVNAPSFFGGIDLSDHRNYWNFGYDALMITDTAFFRNKAYHTVGDTADRLDYVKMALVVDGVNAAVIDAAN